MATQETIKQITQGGVTRDVEDTTARQGLTSKVDKNGTDSLMTAAEHTKLAGIAAGAQVNVINSISVNGTPVTPNNGNVNIIVEGIAGEDGQDGADGKSAYQSYLDTTSDNPKKTEAEWVASLRGQDGVQSGDDVVVVHNFDGDPDNMEQGQVAVLGADMGAVIDEMIDDVNDMVDDLEGAVITSVSGTKLILTPIAQAGASLNVSALTSVSVSAKATGTATTKFTISGRRIESAISIELSDTTHFSVSPSTINAPTGGKLSLTEITVTYTPGSSASVNDSHNCTITVKIGTTTYGTLSLTGTVVSGPSITLDPASLAIGAETNTQGSATINVSGTALENDITLTLDSTSHFSFGESSAVASVTVTKAEAEASGGKDVTVYFDGSGSASASITVTSTGAASETVSVSGSVVARKAEGDTFTVNGLIYTVLADTTTVSVKQTSTSVPSGAVTIPASVQDENSISYSVVKIPNDAFFQNTAITSLVLPDSVTSIGEKATQGMTNLTAITFPNNNTLTSPGLNACNGCKKLTSDNINWGSVTTIPAYGFGNMGNNVKFTIPAQITSIPTNTAFGSTKFDEIRIKGCPSMFIKLYMNSGSKVIIESTTVPNITGGYPFSDGPSPYNYQASEHYKSNATLYVPYAAVSAYRGADKWGDPDGDGHYMFQDQNQILSIEND